MPVRLLGRLAVLLVVDAAALLGLSELLSGFTLSGPAAALGLAAVLGLANAVVWPRADALRAAVHGRDARLRRARAQRRGADGSGGAAGRGGGRRLLVGARGRARADGTDHADRRRAGTRPRRPLVPPHRPPPGQALQARRTHRRPGGAVPGDRRARLRHPAARDARRQRARALALGARRRLSARALGDRLVLADRRLPGRVAARGRSRHAGLPLVGEGRGQGDRHQPPEGRGGDRAPAFQRARAAVRRRREPGEHPLRRRAAQHADDEHGARPLAAGAARAGLLRVLRQPVRRRAHRAADHRRGLHRALRRGSAGAP